MVESSNKTCATGSALETAIELQTMSNSPIENNNDPAYFLPQPSTTVSVVERWNNPKINMWRTFAAFFAFVIMGANDAAYGALIPYVSHFSKNTSSYG
jgi:hypothetical protein